MIEKIEKKFRWHNPLHLSLAIGSVLVPAIFFIASQAESRAGCNGRPEDFYGVAACATDKGVSVFYPDGKRIDISEITEPDRIFRITEDFVDFAHQDNEKEEEWLAKRKFSDGHVIKLSWRMIFN